MTVWLNTYGSDSANGLSPESPKRTFAAAMQALRVAAATAAADVTLYVAGGQDHFVDGASYWTTGNNPPNGIVHVKPYGSSARPWFSGGVPVTGFEQTTQAGIFEASFTGKPRHVWQGRRRNMFRSRLGEANPSYAVFAWDTPSQSLLISSALVPSAAAVADNGLELVVAIGWSKSFLRVFDIVNAGGGLHRVFSKFPENLVEFAKGDLSAPGLLAPFAYGPYHFAGQRFWFENTRQFCDVQGAWHASGSKLRIGTPQGVSSLAQLEHEGIIAGSTPTAFVLSASSVSAPIVPFVFNGIGFKHFDWNTPNDEGYVGYYDGLRLTYNPVGPSLGFGSVPAIIEGYNARGLQLIDCVVADVGGAGVRAFGFKDFTIESSAFVNVASSSVLASSSVSIDAPANGLDPSEISSGFNVRDSVFVDSGATYTGSAIADNCARDTDISYNTFLRGTDGAFSCGFGSRTGGTWASNVKVSWNEFKDLMNFTTDGGAVYFNGNLNGAVATAVPLPHKARVDVFANKFSNIRKSDKDPSGGKTSSFYADLGSTAIWVRQNWFVDCDIAFQENCTLFNRFESNCVGTGVQTRVVSYAGYNSYSPVTGTFTLYEPPLENPPSLTSIAKFDGTGLWTGRAFKDIQRGFATPQEVIDPQGVYQSSSFYADNSVTTVVPKTGHGASAKTLEKFKEYLV